MVYVIQVCWQLASRIRTEFCPDPARKLSANLYDTYHCCVYSEKLLMMDRGTVRSDPACKLSANLYDVYHCCVQWKTPDDGQRNCLKHVEFYSKNKFAKLVHLFVFIIKIYHDARSPERQNVRKVVYNVWVLIDLLQSMSDKEFSLFPLISHECNSSCTAMRKSCWFISYMVCSLY